MGRIGFSTSERTAYVSGSERNNADVLLSKIAVDRLDPKSNRELLLNGIPSESPLQEPESTISWVANLRRALLYGDHVFTINGRKIHSLHLIWNTVLQDADDALKLYTAIDAQCEFNAYVRGENRLWMADIIENADMDIFRPQQGWEGVIDLLRESNEGTVYLSYSSTNDVLARGYYLWWDQQVSTRNIDTASRETLTELDDEWTSMDNATQWEYATQWADSEDGRQYEFSPAKWKAGFYYGNGMTAEKLLQELRESQAVPA